jgi:hypothetical protein
MEMHHVDSSHVHSIGHDAQTNMMHVKFKNGALYEYHNVSADEHHKIRHAGSVGAALKQHTAGKTYHRIG